MTRGAIARAIAEADEPGDLPCFPVAVRNGRRFPWSIALQFAAARDLATLAATHRAARDVCRHEQTAKRVLKARHGRGCKRAKDTKCKCGGCARVALLLRAADTFGPDTLHKLVEYDTESDSDDPDSGADENALEASDERRAARRAASHAERARLARMMWRTGPSRWLRVLDYTEGAAAGRLPVLRLGNATGKSGEGNNAFNSLEGVTIDPAEDGCVYVADTDNHRVQVFRKDDGAHVHTYGVTGEPGRGNHELNRPEGVAVEPGPDGLVYVTDYENHRVQVFCKPV